MTPSRLTALLAFLVTWSLLADASHAFCGFYVAKADTKLFNRASQVVLVRDGDRTVLTMANDFQGDPKEFAVVVPVPTFLEREQIHVGDKAVIDHLDAYTAPRLVEYFDDDPCRVADLMKMRRSLPMRLGAATAEADARAKALGVTIEASYTVGEYDILILSAKQSAGLQTWLTGNGYRLPPGAAPVLGSYLKQGMSFFVAKVNLEEQAKAGFQTLRPLQVAYESKKFMLPIRLGTVNADGPQEMFVYALTRTGRVETTNYRTVRLPTGMDLPVATKERFGDFYKAMFTEQTTKENGEVVFLEYAWDMNWCDPCAADPLSPQELRQLGVFWVDDPGTRPRQPARRIAPSQARNVFVTRLHVRYDRERFPEDLRFQETGDRTNFQGRYVLRHPWTGETQCQQADAYRRGLPQRFDREARTLATLTGWSIADIRTWAKLPVPPAVPDDPWWKTLWPAAGGR